MGFGVFTDVAMGFTWLYGGAFIQCGGLVFTALSYSVSGSMPSSCALASHILTVGMSWLATIQR